jgi:hypothetical protein
MSVFALHLTSYSRVWDNMLNPCATKCLPYCHLLGEGWTLEGIQSSTVERFSSTMEHLLEYEVPTYGDRRRSSYAYQGFND